MRGPVPRAYLDWNASAPLRPEARRALIEALERFGNPSSIHAEGRAARGVIDDARDAVGAFLGCRPSEVVFTSGGTEANHLALATLAATASGRRFWAARVEHPSVTRPLEALEGRGWTARWLEVGGDGRVSAVPDGPGGFAVLQAANHETGAVQPLAGFAEGCARGRVPWHCDGVQGWGRLPLGVGGLGCATASLSGHKLGGPKGVGALYVADEVTVVPAWLGGAQERGRRAGTENVPGIAALAAACEAVCEDREADQRWVRGLRDRLVAGARERVPHLGVNGPADPEWVLPNTVNLSVPGIPSDTLVQAFDLEGVAVSAGSACASGAVGLSPVLVVMGLPEWQIESAIRISLGPTTKPEEIDLFLAALERVVRR